jgi:hypothetical protein
MDAFGSRHDSIIGFHFRWIFTLEQFLHIPWPNDVAIIGVVQVLPNVGIICGISNCRSNTIQRIDYIVKEFAARIVLTRLPAIDIVIEDLFKHFGNPMQRVGFVSL